MYCVLFFLFSDAWYYFRFEECERRVNRKQSVSMAVGTKTYDWLKQSLQIQYIQTLGRIMLTCNASRNNENRNSLTIRVTICISHMFFQPSTVWLQSQASSNLWTQTSPPLAGPQPRAAAGVLVGGRYGTNSYKFLEQVLLLGVDIARGKLMFPSRCFFFYTQADSKPKPCQKHWNPVLRDHGGYMITLYFTLISGVGSDYPIKKPTNRQTIRSAAAWLRTIP